MQGFLNIMDMRNAIKYLVLTAIIVAGGFLLWYFRSVFVFIAIAAVLSLITRPLFEVFKKWHIGKFFVGNRLAALFTVLIIWVFIGLFFRYTIPLIGGELHYLSSVDFPQVFDSASLLLKEALEPFKKIDPEIIDSLELQIREAVKGVFDVSQITDAFSGMVGFFGGLFIAAFSITFITFFFLKEEGLLVRLLMMMIPDEHEEGLRHVLLSVKFLLRRYFLGVLLQIFLICFFVTSGFLILGLSFNHAVTIGIVSGLFNVIPYVGPVIGSLFGLLTSSIIYLQVPFEMSFLTFLGFAALVYVIVQLMDNLLFQPLIFSSSVQAHPLEIFIVILMSGYLSGVVGMFLAIPVYTIFRVVGREFFYKYRVVKKLTDGLG
jgi:predicted PurR-regulated permease PerM